MAQFMSLGFTYDGLAGEDLGYYIVNMSGDSNELGLKKSIEEGDNNHSIKTYYGVKYNEFSFSIDIVKMPPNHSSYEILPITEEDINFLNKWLLKPKDYKVFSSDQNRDIYYYAMFTSMKETRIGTRGYLTLEMRLNGGFAYSSIIHHQYVVNILENNIRINTKSTVDDYIYPDIILTVEDTSNIEIKNETLGESMVFENLPSGTYMCYNEDMKHIQDITNPKKNLRPYFNGEWLRLIGNGVNILSVSGSCKIDICFQNKIAIQH